MPRLEKAFGRWHWSRATTRFGEPASDSSWLPHCPTNKMVRMEMNVSIDVRMDVLCICFLRGFNIRYLSLESFLEYLIHFRISNQWLNVGNSILLHVSRTRAQEPRLIPKPNNKCNEIHTCRMLGWNFPFIQDSWHHLHHQGLQNVTWKECCGCDIWRNEQPIGKQQARVYCLMSECSVTMFS